MGVCPPGGMGHTDHADIVICGGPEVNLTSGGLDTKASHADG